MDTKTNPQLDLAYEYVQNTHKNIFLTGKAGTGKTTFLHQIKRESLKRMVVVAPTGVAAINAGGMTIHSFFQLPFGPFLPGREGDPSQQRRFTGEKIRLIQSLDLLVIDEISMVRADVLDGMDSVLRRYRNRSKPFGGVQLLMIGDLHQLPPVVKDEEWNLLREHYDTAYFFGSHALRDTHPVSIELKHIYRQSDGVFIQLLNKVRNNQVDAAVLEALNSRYVPDFQPTEQEPYITLTAHNAAAQTINAEQLERLSEPEKAFKATIADNFPAFAYPADEHLVCKKGAQVMFVKNDMAREKRFYNGKIGQITGFGEGVVYVKCPGDHEEIAVTPAEWSNVKYSLNEKTKEVSEELLGTFTQYPLKLAWAITIHKSQGLTFERAIIDAQAAFAHGQVYVALSRCKSFEGIVLRSKIISNSVKTDRVVQHYTEEADRNAPDETHLTRSKSDFQQALILELFDFGQMASQIKRLQRVFLENESILLKELGPQIETILTIAREQIVGFAERFKTQLPPYFAQETLPESQPGLQTRLEKAGAFFSEKLNDVLLPPVLSLSMVTDNKSVKKLLQEAVEALHKDIFVKNACFSDMRNGFSAICYLKIRTNAELDFAKIQATPSPAATTNSIPKDLKHPALFARFKKWRDDMAQLHDIPHFQVMHTLTLVEITYRLPQDLQELKRIKGIGAQKIERFGADIIALVKEYCSEHESKTGEKIAAASLPIPENPAKVDTKLQSLALFQAGKSPAEIAQARGLVTSTIESHLAHFVGLGELDILQLIPQENLTEMETYFRENRMQTMKDVKIFFGDKYSYAQLTIVRNHLSSLEES